LTVYYLFTFVLASFFALSQGLGGFTFFVTAGGALFFICLLLVVAAIVVLLFIFIKTLWLLLKTYAMIILQIILAPIQILLGAIAPAGGGFSGWLRSIAANLAVYPTVGFMFLLAFIFLRAVFDSATIVGVPIGKLPGFDWVVTHLMPFNINGGLIEQGTWDPPLTWGAGASGILYLSISFVIITLIPKTADIIKSMIEKKPFNYGTAIGEAVTPAKGVGLYAAAQGMNIAERVAEKEGKQQTPPWVQVGRKLLGLKSQ
jgi:hypothetical protein